GGGAGGGRATQNTTHPTGTKQKNRKNELKKGGPKTEDTTKEKIKIKNKHKKKKKKKKDQKKKKKKKK
ncbi:hypothetical protein MZH23_26895, partial [Escherichia coli]|nr:hypothetical protein [Escherichia coli]